jgi:hypothetical protein
LEDFLFATIGDEQNGMLLSVNSALARSGVDPWAEAEILARLPADTATQKLARLVAALPDGPAARPDSGTVAARLIALLPRHAGSKRPEHPTVPVAGPGSISWAVKAVIVLGICMLFVLNSQWFGGGRQAAPADKASAPAYPAVKPQVPTPSPGQ